jgi:hypothetical protein
VDEDAGVGSAGSACRLWAFGHTILGVSWLMASRTAWKDDNDASSKICFYPDVTPSQSWRDSFPIIQPSFLVNPLKDSTLNSSSIVQSQHHRNARLLSTSTLHRNCAGAGRHSKLSHNQPLAPCSREAGYRQQIQRNRKNARSPADQS